VETFKLANVDPHIKLQLARRVYINYISLDAPLLLNLSQDIREKIEWPQLGVPASFFDEAQVTEKIRGPFANLFFFFFSAGARLRHDEAPFVRHLPQERQL